MSGLSSNLSLPQGEYLRRQALASSLGYLSTAENRRVDRLRDLRMLFDGLHREFFITRGRTQFYFPAVRRNDGALVAMYVPMNLLTLVSMKMADLLVGEPPALRVDDEAEQVAVEAMAERSHLHRVLHDACVDLSWAGEAALEVIGVDGATYIANAPVDEIFPQGYARPDGQYDRYHLYATRNVGTEQSPIWLMLQTVYEPGVIRRECWQLTSQFGTALSRVALAEWSKLGPAMQLAEEERTGLDRPSIIWLCSGRPGEPVSDYTQLIPMQDSLSAKNSQLNRVHAKHADPKIFFVTAQAGPDGGISASDDAIFGDSKEAKPEYIDFNSQSQSAMADRDFAVQAFCLMAEIPPSLLGIKSDATAESARKMRLSAANALAKAARRAAAIRPAIRLALQLARQMEGGPAGLDVSVEMRDGLPNDDQERADVIATLRAAGAISIEGALELRGLDKAAIDKELARIADDAKASMPTALVGEPNQLTLETESAEGPPALLNRRDAAEGISDV
jgi:hypothetical protein